MISNEIDNMSNVGAICHYFLSRKFYHRYAPAIIMRPF
jgi:hypothetical protein